MTGARAAKGAACTLPVTACTVDLYRGRGAGAQFLLAGFRRQFQPQVDPQPDHCGSATAERGLREAIALASDQRTRARSVLLHVVGDFSMRVEMSAAAAYMDMLEGLRRYGQDMLAKAKAAAAVAGIEAGGALRELSQGRRWTQDARGLLLKW